MDVRALEYFAPCFLFASSRWMNGGSWEGGGSLPPPGKDAALRGVLLQSSRQGLREHCPRWCRHVLASSVAKSCPALATPWTVVF